MSILRPISIFLRNFLIKQHPYFSCCASCGEIQTPLGTRLCTSLSPSFSIDAVIIPDSSDAGVPDAVQALRSQLPWLRNVIVVGRQNGVSNNTSNTFWITEAFFETLLMDQILSADRRAGLEAYYHLLPELGEYYLVFTKDSPQTSAELDPLDFYTPNGLPLLSDPLVSHLPTGAALQKNRNDLLMQHLLDSTEDISPPRVYAHSKSDAAEFLVFFEHYLQLAEAYGVHGKAYSLVLSQWLYITGRGVAVPRTSFS